MTTSVTSVSGASLPDYPQTTTVNTEQCGLTEEVAENVVKSLTSTTTSTSNGVTKKLLPTTVTNNGEAAGVILCAFGVLREGLSYNCRNL